MNISTKELPLSFVTVSNSSSPIGKQSVHDYTDLINRTGSSTGQPLLGKVSKSSGLTVLNINFRGIRGKVSDFLNLLFSLKPDIILGTESWLSAEIHNSEVFPNNYQVFRKDRLISDSDATDYTEGDRNWGGVFIAIKAGIACEDLPSLNVNCEITWCKIILSNKKSLLLSCFYRPPKSNLAYMELFQESLQKAVSLFPKALVLTGGDFNLPDIDWELCRHIPCGQYAACNKLLLDIADQHGLEQLVHYPTRIDKHSGTANILDIMLSNSPELITDVQIMDGLSDHKIVNVSIKDTNRDKYLESNKRTIYSYDRANTDALKEQFDSQLKDFSDNFQSRGIEENWQLFKDIYTTLINTFVPNKMASDVQYPMWYTRQFIRLLRKQERLHKRAKNSKCSLHFEQYSVFRSLTQKEGRKLHLNFLNSILGTSLKNDNGKMFYKYIKSMKKGSFGLPPLKTQKGVLTNDPVSKVNILNKQYEQVYTKEDVSQLPTLGMATSERMPSVNVSTAGVLKLLKHLNDNKSCGPDGIHPKILKSCAEVIAPYLTLIFQQSLDSGKLPSDWLLANVCPIFKSGSKSDPANYRPISLTCVCSKLMEHIISSSLMTFLIENNVLLNSQHGFRKGLSCETQLLMTYHDIAEKLDRGKQMDLVFLDFSKAFDRVPHQRLLLKLKSYGVDDRTLNWIEGFLSNRTQRVTADSVSSDLIAVLSGVPQGSVLGPLLFLIYINDINKDLASCIRLFADDCLIYRSIETSKDIDSLQSDLDRIFDWCESWNMVLNIKKCAVVRVNRKETVINGSHPYTINGEHLNITNSYKYLGVRICDNLQWNEHVETVVGKANRTLRLMKRALGACPADVKAAAYVSLVRPQLEYASMVWDPYQGSLKADIEKVQNRAARFVTNIYDRQSSITAILKALTWCPLGERRANARMKMLYKIYNNMIPVEDIGAQLLKPNYIGHNDHIMKICRMQASHQFFQWSFFPRGICEWNSLPEHVVTAPTIDSFSSRLEKFRRSGPSDAGTTTCSKV